MGVGEFFVAGNGPVGDREFVVVDEQGKFLTQRQLPAMARISARRIGLSLQLSVDGRQVVVPYRRQGESVRVKVWSDEIDGFHTETEANLFLSDFLGRPVQLVQYTPSTPRMKQAETDQSYETRFTDQCQVLLTTEASLTSLNQGLVEPIPMDRFRANVVIDGDLPWTEESWRRIRLGAMEFEVMKPCSRCKIVTTDQLTGEVGSARPLEVLKNEVKGEQPKAYFGMYLRALGTGNLAVGDEVEVLKLKRGAPAP